MDAIVFVPRDVDLCPGCYRSYTDLGDRAGTWSYSQDEGYTCTCTRLPTWFNYDAAGCKVCVRCAAPFGTCDCDVDEIEQEGQGLIAESGLS